MEFKDIVQKRYAVKKFDGKAVPQEKVDELLEMIRLAPSSYNLQPWKIKVIEDQETKVKLLAESYNQQQVSSCSHLLVFCADTDYETNLQKLEEQMRAAGGDKEKLDAYFGMMKGGMGSKSKEEVAVWAKNQVYLALGNALNGAASLGFNSCPMEGFNPEGYRKILDLPENLIPCVLCPIGYPADTPRPKLRFEKEDVLF